MMGRAALLVAAVGAALAAPGNAVAVDHVTLFVSPTTVSQPGWKLSAAVAGPTERAARETFGISLTRKVRQRARGGAARSPRRADRHGLLRRPRRPLADALRHGCCDRHDPDRDRPSTGPRRVPGLPRRIRKRAGEAARQLRPQHWDELLRDDPPPVLSGSVTFNRGGPVDCSAPAFEICSPSSLLTAVRQGSAGPAATLLLSPDAGGWLTLSFADRGGKLPAGTTWYHVMRAERLGFDPLAGRPPSIAVDLPAALAVRGSGRFAATETTQGTRGDCRRVTTTGTFAGSFRTRFAGWGARTVAFARSGLASFAEESA
jgi:hypothetical protein